MFGNLGTIYLGNSESIVAVLVDNPAVATCCLVARGESAASYLWSPTSCIMGPKGCLNTAGVKGVLEKIETIIKERVCRSPEDELEATTCSQ